MHPRFFYGTDEKQDTTPTKSDTNAKQHYAWCLEQFSNYKIENPNDLADAFGQFKKNIAASPATASLLLKYGDEFLYLSNSTTLNKERLFSYISAIPIENQYISISKKMT